MRYGDKASKKAQAKALRLIGPKGIVARVSDNFLVGEVRGTCDIRYFGKSKKSFRQAFEMAGLSDPEQIKNSRV